MQEPRQRDAETSDDRDDERNELGHRNVDEGQEHDERGSQRPGSEEPPARKK